MKTLIRLGACALPIILVTAAAPLRADTLKMGDPAPALQNGPWIQGEPVTAFDPRHVYVLEFWATWSGACRTSIPHLNELSQKFADRSVTVIGQDISEADENAVRSFVHQMGGNMTYRVALDDRSQDTNGAMAVHWMKAAAQNAIPRAFVINRHGNIAWIGNPMNLDAATLQQILDDTFDSAAYAREFERQQQQQLDREALSQTLRQAMLDKDWNGAEAALADIEKTMPENVRYQADPVRLQILLARGDSEDAYQLAESSSDSRPADAYIQNQLAWTLATARVLDPRGLALAGKIAARAAAACNEKEPGILDTLARVQFMNGQTNEAIVTEQKAVAAAPDESKAALQRILASYQLGKLPDLGQ